MPEWEIILHVGWNKLFSKLCGFKSRAFPGLVWTSFSFDFCNNANYFYSSLERGKQRGLGGRHDCMSHRSKFTEQAHMFDFPFMILSSISCPSFPLFFSVEIQSGTLCTLDKHSAVKL